MSVRNLGLYFVHLGEVALESGSHITNNIAESPFRVADQTVGALGQNVSQSSGNCIWPVAQVTPAQVTS